MTDISLADQRKQLMEQLHELDLAEARNDLTILQDVAGLLAQNSLAQLVKNLEAQAANVLNPSRRARIEMFIQAVNATRENVDLFAREAKQILGLPQEEQ